MKLLQWAKKAMKYCGRNDEMKSFGVTVETKKGHHIEFGYIDGDGYIWVDGEKKYPVKDKK